jgi:hypothetical protein
MTLVENEVIESDVSRDLACDDRPAGELLAGHARQRHRHRRFVSGRHNQGRDRTLPASISLSNGLFGADIVPPFATPHPLVHGRFPQAILVDQKGACLNTPRSRFLNSCGFLIHTC